MGTETMVESIMINLNFGGKKKYSTFSDYLENHSEIKQLVAEFLDLWKRAHTAHTVSEVLELESQAFERWDKVEEIAPHDMGGRFCYGTRFLLLDWDSTGYPMPSPSAGGHWWRVCIFRAQMERAEKKEKRQRDRQRKLVKLRRCRKS